MNPHLLPHSLPPDFGCITRVAGLQVGHYTDTRRPTGCTVVLTPQGAVAGVDVRGAAPGTRETDLLTPGNLVDRVHAVLLTGGSAFGLDAATGVMRWLEAHGYGFAVGPAHVPIVPAAVLFDLTLGNAQIRPDAQAGYAACEAAMQQRLHDELPQGNVGAGAGAVVGKLFGLDRAMKGGLGTASLTVGGVTVGALVACNALGDVRDPDTGTLLAGARTQANQRQLLNSEQALCQGLPLATMRAGSNTTIGLIATDARLNTLEVRRLAQLGHDGLARSINPVHTAMDGDTLFALATGLSTHAVDPIRLGVMAARVTALATVAAVQHAQALTVGSLHLPAWQG